ncbi:MAG TPA: hypothetical protein VF043_29745 [Ktedonobacteraceae bacterium]
MSETTVSPGAHRTESTRLHGRWLIIARVVWVTVVVFTLSIFLLSLPGYVAQLQTICAGDTCVYAYGQLTAGTAQALQNLGLSTGGYAVSILSLVIASALVSFGVAALIFWRRSADWMAMFVSLFLVIIGVNLSVQAQAILATNGQTAWYWSHTVLIGLGWVSLSLLLYLFPDGRFVPRWTLLLAVFVVASNLFLDAYPDAFSSLPSWVISAIFLINGGPGVVAQIYRYVRVSGPVQRQQTKWVVFGLAATVLVLLGRDMPLLIFPSFSASSSPYFLLSTYVYPLGFLLIPLTLGIAILRYRLWDIDILINRTLVYGTLTGLLALLYVGLVISLQALFNAVTRQVGTSPVVIVISTLAIAALFQPLRHRTQKIIDRRFYRRKYDATHTLAAFNATLRNEVDLSQLSEQLVAVVEETMQPTSVSLWLRTPGQERRPGTNQLSQLNGVPGKEET